MRYSVALTDTLHEKLRSHLAREDGQEDLCFAVWYPSGGETRYTALLHLLILPLDGEREVHGNAAFLPAYFERALGLALAAGGGLSFLHSHPASGWQGMSGDDIRAEQGMAAAVLAATRLPLVGLTLAAEDATWSARVWQKTAPRRYDRRDCDSVRVIGEALRVSFNDRLRPVPRRQPSQQRTIDAWGRARQADLARLKVGVVGLGSVGSVVAENLARVGIQEIALIDHGTLEEVNLDRTLNAFADDSGRAKVSVAADACRTSATSGMFTVEEVESSVCEPAGYRRALDCDVLFSCVDRPWPRAVLNFIGYAHLIPVVDGGILVSRTSSGLLRDAHWKAHTVGHSRRCLLCLGQYEPWMVSLEQSGMLDDSAYIEGLHRDDMLRANQNVFPFSVATASLEVLQFLALVIQPGGVSRIPPQDYHFKTGWIDLPLPDEPASCDPDCVFPPLTARGESAGHPGIGKHSEAERAREERRARVRES